MKVTFQKTDLLNGINTVLKAVPGKSTMPILECILLDIKDNIIKMTANNMELGIETILEGNIIEEGTIAINAKLFSEIIRKLPDSIVTIETEIKNSSMNEYGEVAHITCEKAKFDIAVRNHQEFPILPQIEKEQQISISQFSLKELIRQTVFSISDDENNKIMTGELFEIKGNELQVVALDGFRISIRRIKLKEDYGNIKVIVPGKTLIEVNKILSGEMEDEVIISFTSKHILFEFDNTVVLSRLIEGEYYKIEHMLSSDYETKVGINKKEFLSCIDRASLLVSESEKRPILLDIKNSGMELKIDSSIGSMKEEVDIQKTGKDILIGFNPKYLMDALRVIDEEDIDMYLFNPKAPCFIKNEEETYIYLIIPVMFNKG